MSAGEVNPREQRVLVLAPDEEDATFVGAVLSQAGLAVEFCADGDALCAAVAEGAGAVVAADGAFTPATAVCLQETLARQPAWSDLPLVLLAREGQAPSAAVAEPGVLASASPQSSLVNVTL